MVLENVVMLISLSFTHMKVRNPSNYVSLNDRAGICPEKFITRLFYWEHIIEYTDIKLDDTSQ